MTEEKGSNPLKLEEIGTLGLRRAGLEEMRDVRALWATSKMVPWLQEAIGYCPCCLEFGLCRLRILPLMDGRELADWCCLECIDAFGAESAHPHTLFAKRPGIFADLLFGESSVEGPSKRYNFSLLFFTPIQRMALGRLGQTASARDRLIVDNVIPIRPWADLVRPAHQKPARAPKPKFADKMLARLKAWLGRF